MNDTNRGLNRVVLVIAGLVLVIAGGTVLTTLVWPTAASLWDAGAEVSREWIAETGGLTQVWGTSWLALGGVAALIVVAALLLAIPLRVITQRSHPREAGVVEETALGRIVVSESFVSDTLRQSLVRREEILAAHVGMRLSRGEQVLHVNVTPRRSTAPRDVTQTVERLVANLATLTGSTTPTVLTIRSGLRARLAADPRRVD